MIEGALTKLDWVLVAVIVAITACVYRNLSSGIVVVKSAKDGM
jgi:hypothetical protein